MEAHPLEQLFDGLTAREKLVVAHRFGLLEREPATLEATGAMLDVTRERARQIEARALARLRARAARLGVRFDDLV